MSQKSHCCITITRYHDNQPRCIVSVLGEVDPPGGGVVAHRVGRGQLLQGLQGSTGGPFVGRSAQQYADTADDVG